MPLNHQYIAEFIKMTFTDPVSGTTNEIIFSNAEIRTVTTSARETVQTVITEEGKAVQTFLPRPWRWTFELINECPETYGKMDDVLAFVRARYSLSANILTGYPVYNSSIKSMNNVPGLGAMPSAVVRFGDDIDIRSIERGFGARWRWGVQFDILESITYVFPGGTGTGGGGGGN